MREDDKFWISFWSIVSGTVIVLASILAHHQDLKSVCDLKNMQSQIETLTKANLELAKPKSSPLGFPPILINPGQ